MNGWIMIACMTLLTSFVLAKQHSHAHGEWTGRTRARHRVRRLFSNSDDDNNGRSLRFSIDTNCSVNFRNYGQLFINSTDEDITNGTEIVQVKSRKTLALLEKAASSQFAGIVELDGTSANASTAIVQFVWRNVVRDTPCYWRIDRPLVGKKRDTTGSRTLLSLIVDGLDNIGLCTVTNETYTINGTDGWVCSGCSNNSTVQFVSNIVRITGSGEQNNPIISETVTGCVYQIRKNTTASEWCSKEIGWDRTRAGENATRIGGCYFGAVNKIRYCDSNGIWHEPYCLETEQSKQLRTIIDQALESPLEGLQSVQTELSQPLSNISLEQSAVLVDTILDTAMQVGTFVNTTVQQRFVQDIVNVFENLTLILLSKTANEKTMSSIGSLILISLDELALSFINETNGVKNFSNGIFLQVIEVNSSTVNDYIKGIEVGQNIIWLPAEVVKSNDTTLVRIVSFLYKNISSLLTPKDNISTIVSPVISSTTNCQSCPVMNLTNNVTIQLEIQQGSMKMGKLSCVFYEFEFNERQLPTGDWSSRGCTVIDITDDIVTCSCNHLTHFAILLSPGAEGIAPIHYEILSTVSLVLVPISLVCMVLIILTYSLMRSLWSMRNYIHIMLCVSLFMAQLLFIVGVDKTENEGVCSAVAVLLQYLFLVTFMWMLMEGVVLYVTLVRVFITNFKYYMIAFTVASYGIPAVYMAGIIPIGYLVNVDDIPRSTHYFFIENGNLTACWLSYETNFIWSFIVPVALIILTNFGFFIMAATVMCKHFKKEKRRKSVSVKHWLKVSITLTVVMGIAWLAGVLTFRRELLSVFYIITVFIAGQGIILFIVLLPLSKQVRDSYKKLWKCSRSPSTTF